MTTLKPQIVRADTLDLQSHNAPSAQDHTRQPVYTSPYGYNAAGPHHTQALRNANEGAYHEQQHSPRVNEIGNGRIDSQNQTNLYEDAEDDEDTHTYGASHGTSHPDHEYDDVIDGDESHDEDMDDDMLDKISSSPSIEDEDIDFEFVYALHTFVATVEGQANATKGDTMVLLDDSNSYWWLVRVVKDGSIGYLPAEHIETPTERLARLNKHRNIDLSASMLGDNPEKSKNPLKKAMRRRNAKTVNFTAPTYHEPPDVDWSDEDEDEDTDEHQLEAIENADREDEEDAREEQQTQQAAVEDVKLAATQQSEPTSNGVQRAVKDDQAPTNETPNPAQVHAVTASASQVPSQESSLDASLKSRKPLVRNTDSFFNDTAETRKISLTPRLLRGDSETTNSSEPHDVRQPTSPDTFDKFAEEKARESSKKKEKKGMLSGLFKRKDKNSRGTKNDHEEERISEEAGRPTQTKDGQEGGAERKPSKLHKNPPSLSSSKHSSIDASTTQSLAPSESAFSGAIYSSVTMSAPTESLIPNAAAQDSPEQAAPARFPSLNEKRSVFAPITTVLKSKPSHEDAPPQVKPVYSKRAKERFAIDDSDSADEGTLTKVQSLTQTRGVSPVDARRPQQTQSDLLSQPSPSEPTLHAEIPRYSVEASRDDEARLTQHTRNQSANANTDTTTYSEHTASPSKTSPSIPTHTPSTSRSTPTWSDASLRSYMDNDQDIRDLLVIVHDRSNVTPVGNDHPLMGGLFTNERTRLAEMQSQLDSMLTGWISKKNPTLVAKA